MGILSFLKRFGESKAKRSKYTNFLYQYSSMIIRMIRTKRLIVDSISEIGKIICSRKKRFQNLDKINEFLSKKPLMLKLETTNICNAHCCFCGYPKMQRRKQVMKLDLFEKVVNDYALMGGGQLH